MSTALLAPQRQQTTARTVLLWLQRGLAVLALVCIALALAARPASAAPGPPPRHVVQPGDTLTTIAQQYGSSADAIMAANALADPDRIEVGQV
ncbi:MAG: LysM domain-containing protein, partial [Anaerolineae bacterium]